MQVCGAERLAGATGRVSDSDTPPSQAWTAQRVISDNDKYKLIRFYYSGFFFFLIRSEGRKAGRYRYCYQQTTDVDILLEMTPSSCYDLQWLQMRWI